MTKQVNNSLVTFTRTGRRWLIGSCICLVTSITYAQTVDDSAVFQRCATAEHERILQQLNPNRLQQLKELNRQIQQTQADRKSRQQADNTIYRIPVVVHVIHSTASGVIGGSTTNGNISEAQILSQIQVLNEDYRRQAGTNGYNTSPIGADAGIEFFLATTNPDGKPTNGITRHYYAQKSSFNATSYTDDLLLSQIAYWPSDRYLNIWVTSLQNNYLGYTPQFPTIADTLQGLPGSSDEYTDGTVIDYRVFGRQTGTVTRTTYALGRTVTHEIGHWLGLLHPNGDVNCGDDYVADTPLTDDLNQTNVCRDLFSNCSGVRTRELIENYLMYSPDVCMNMFTAGQVGRMRAVLQLSPRRIRLIKSVASPLTETPALTISVYPNPATADPSVDVQLKGFQTFNVDLFDVTGRQLRALTYTDAPSSRVSLSVAGLASGIYIVRVKTGSEMVSKRLVIQ